MNVEIHWYAESHLQYARHTTSNAIHLQSIQVFKIISLKFDLVFFCFFSAQFDAYFGTHSIGSLNFKIVFITKSKLSHKNAGESRIFSNKKKPHKDWYETQHTYFVGRGGYHTMTAASTLQAHTSTSSRSTQLQQKYWAKKTDDSRSQVHTLPQKCNTYEFYILTTSVDENAPHHSWNAIICMCGVDVE